MSEELLNTNADVSRVELDIQISTAKKYPRDVRKCVENMKFMATIDQETAESMYYVLKRKDKDIIGPSIRMAEVALACWTNMHVGKRIIGNNGTIITAQAIAWDLESNIKIDTSVDRSIKYANGGTYSVDMQVVTGNAAASIALRNAIFSIIPKIYIELIYKECRKCAVGEGNLFIKRRNQVVDRLVNIGANPQEMLLFFGRKTIDDLTEDDVADLIGVGTAIKEGLLKANDAFSLNDDMKTMHVKDRIACITAGKSKIKALEVYE